MLVPYPREVTGGGRLQNLVMAARSRWSREPLLDLDVGKGMEASMEAGSMVGMRARTWESGPLLAPPLLTKLSPCGLAVLLTTLSSQRRVSWSVAAFCGPCSVNAMSEAPAQPGMVILESKYRCTVAWFQIDRV